VAPDPTQTPPWEEVRDQLARDRSPAWLDAFQFTFDSRYVLAAARYADYAANSFTPGRPILEAALDLTRRIHKAFVYDPRATTLATPVAEVFEKRRGVCQDFAHLMLACLRSLGLAVRYVSGYLSTVPPPGKERLVGADATHAWVSVFCGLGGWIDLDPTNDQIPADRHVLLAWGRDYDDVSPLKGVILGGGQHVVKVSVDVLPEGPPVSGTG
jgi:transglutaminase-like putative cysteine protease